MSILQFSVPQVGGNGQEDNSPIRQLPKSLKEALGNRQRPLSIRKAYTDANPNYSPSYAAYSENCQRAVVAYEMRRRGYNVEAQPTYSNDKWPRVLMVNGIKQGFWRGAFRHAKSEKIGGQSADSTLNRIRGKMREYGDGSRAVISITYKGGRLGHVFNVENVRGATYYIDAQSGQRYNTPSMRNLLGITQTTQTTITRTDNLRPSGRMAEFVWEPDKTSRLRR
ncbi:MAG: toxin glutamine deamidase domain-containing protein [Bilifractor sp.]